MRTWALNPPCGLFSRNLNLVMVTFCNSLVVGKDAVSRGTVNNLSRLMDEMVTALARCRYSLHCICPSVAVTAILSVANVIQQYNFTLL